MAYCLCLILSPKASDEIAAIGFTNLTMDSTRDLLDNQPAPLCTSFLGPYLIVLFFVGATIVFVGELMLPRKIGALILLGSSVIFYGVTFGILAGLQGQCPGPYYRDSVILLGWLCLSTGLLACIGILLVFLIIRKESCKLCVSYNWDEDRKRIREEQTMHKNDRKSQAYELD